MNLSIRDLFDTYRNILWELKLFNPALTVSPKVHYLESTDSQHTPTHTYTCTVSKSLRVDTWKQLIATRDSLIHSHEWRWGRVSKCKPLLYSLAAVKSPRAPFWTAARSVYTQTLTHTCTWWMCPLCCSSWKYNYIRLHVIPVVKPVIHSHNLHSAHTYLQPYGWVRSGSDAGAQSRRASSRRWCNWQEVPLPPQSSCPQASGRCVWSPPLLLPATYRSGSEPGPYHPPTDKKTEKRSRNIWTTALECFNNNVPFSVSCHSHYSGAATMLNIRQTLRVHSRRCDNDQWIGMVIC